MEPRDHIPQLLRGFAESLARSAPDEEYLLRAATESCRDLLQAKQCSVWLVDPLGTRLVLQAATGYTNLDEADIGRLYYPLERPDGTPVGITAWIHINQERVSARTYDELRAHEGYRGEFDRELHNVDKEEVTLHPCQQFYGAPIYLGEERFGVLKVENKRGATMKRKTALEFSSADQAALDTVAAIIALSLKHARAGKQAQDQLHEYNSFTVHSIRNEIVAIQAGMDVLQRASKELDYSPRLGAAIDEALRFLRIGIQGLGFYLDHLVKFLQAELDPQEMGPVSIKKLVDNEVWLLGELASDDLEATHTPHCDDNVMVRADPEFLSAAIKELLRNSRKAVYRRRQSEKREDSEMAKGRVTIELFKPESRPSSIHLVIADDGDASVDEEARKALDRAWNRVRSGEKSPRVSQKGLSFVDWVISKHGGEFTRDEHQEAGQPTRFTISIPLAQQD